MQSFESVCKTDLKNFIRNTIGETKIYSYRKSLSLSRHFHCRAFSWNLCKISLKSKKFQPACTLEQSYKHSIPSTLNTDYLLWHTQLFVCAVNHGFRL